MSQNKKETKKRPAVEKCVSGCNGSQAFRAGVLTINEIEEHKLIEVIHLEEGQKEECKQITTYDLHLGELHYVSTDNDWKPVFLGDTTTEDFKNNIKGQTFYVNEDLECSGSLIIPPFGRALIQLYETVDTLSIVKNDGYLVVGHFDLKLSKVAKGLISQQATQIEPYYKGKLFCYLFNFSNENIELKYRERIVSIEFSYIACSASWQKDKFNSLKEKYLKKSASKYKGDAYCYDGEGIKDVRYFAKGDKPRKLPEGGGLRSFIEKINKGLVDINSIQEKFNEKEQELLKTTDEAKKVIQQADEKIKQLEKEKEERIKQVETKKKEKTEKKRFNKNLLVGILAIVIPSLITIINQLGIALKWWGV